MSCSWFIMIILWFPWKFQHLLSTFSSSTAWMYEAFCKSVGWAWHTYAALCSLYIPVVLIIHSLFYLGECRPSWWVWMILVFIVLSLIASCICCICCGICSCILDCLCCCRWTGPPEGFGKCSIIWRNYICEFIFQLYWIKFRLINNK